MSGAKLRIFAGPCLLALALVPGHAAARTGPSPEALCAVDSAREYRFDRGLEPDWLVAERPMKTPAAPYPDGSTDGDTRANVLTGGGMLHLTSRRTWAGYTGSRLLSRRLVRYGCVEFVARLPHGRGFWPALWLRTPYDGSPIDGEIDVLEGFGSHPGVFMSTLHHWRNGIDAPRPHPCAKVVAADAMAQVDTGLALARARIVGTEPAALGNWLFASHRNACSIFPVHQSANFAADFHRYMIVWTPDRVIWLLDGRRYFETVDDVPQVAMMIVMCLSVGSLDGGTSTGTPASGELTVRSVRIMDLKPR